MKLELPKFIPVFPLNGVIYFPETNLPLNIFEQRYLDLVNDCYKSNKYMGMVQLKKESHEVYKIGCLGKITKFIKNKDGRVLINLSGISRFSIKKEINNSKLYREFEVEYKSFIEDVNVQDKNIKKINFEILLNKIKKFFEKSGILLNWNEFNKLNLNQKINTLAMISPISCEEKQTLLETIAIDEKVEVLSNIIEFYLHKTGEEKNTLQ